MTDMIERVAAAIVKDLWAKGILMDEMDIPEDQEWPSERDISRVITPFKQTARAAIEAMREPTPEMLAFAFEQPWEIGTPMKQIWQYMIDAALKKKEKKND